MNLANLSFSGLPPIDVPFRYFITAPLFVIAIAITMFLLGESLWISRWQVEMLAITHSFTLGFIASIMMGALYQLLPVTAGLCFPKPRLVATLCHLLHTVGTILLIIGFLLSDHLIQISAAIILAIGFFLYLSVVGYLLVKGCYLNKKQQNQDNASKKHQNLTLKGIKLAVIALIFTVCLGLLLQTKIIGLDLIAWNRDFTNLHATWGLIGWVGILIVSISFQVIPMFHVAPEFPKKLKTYLPLAILVALALLTLSKFTPLLTAFQPVIQLLLLLLNCLFVVFLLKTINQRKRKIPDTSIKYWQLAAASIIVIALIYLLPEALLPLLIIQKFSLLLSAIFIFGYVVSILQGMLLKILPFLVFTHLQQRCMINFTAMQALPNMHEILSKAHGRYLFILHCLSGISLILTILQPKYYWLLAGLLLVEFSWLTFLIAKAYYLYRHFNKKISALLN
jgi:hypothetical protein